ncbi:tricarballylate utilization 4Fe-4S protein TcuB [Acidimangrovimonas pyrenivorans]|uniref:Tricarballylate utilization 4Fe-4S protein TcuB n=1 Tax=Acidimangrovimonas pyrenivorans TaxID=2030798 RepID=A0ABV7AFV6_9RHOB
MPPDPSLDAATGEARRQVGICNACRYCEGYCAVFPAMTRNKSFAGADLLHLANLCHNCRGCFYACQYTAPHEFALNLPAALAELRQGSWEAASRPRGLARLFHRSAAAQAAVLVVATLLIALAAALLRPAGGRAFYATLSHGTLVAIFGTVFGLALLALAAGLRRYWRDSGGGRVRLADLIAALQDAARLRNLDGGQGQGCNFEAGDRYSNARRWAHQATLWGFLLCFAATCVATVMHYAFALHAPYGPFSPPKLLGLPGGLLLCTGTLWLATLKRRADPALGATGLRKGESGFTWMLFWTGASGLALYAARGGVLATPLLIVHLGAVLALFALLPYSKMVHGAYRLAALTSEAARRRAARAH